MKEEVLTQDDFFLKPSVNQAGMLFLPVLNEAMNGLNSWDYHNPKLQRGINIYPGEKWCNPVIPHAKWHLQTGVALTDFSFLSDELYMLLSAASKK